MSSEVSPSGLIHLVEHCWIAVFRLLRDGILCRGYLTRGRIFHTDTELVGSGYQDALEKEKTVSTFRREADERGTPYVEIDPAVTAYVDCCGDGCVKEMFSRMVKTDGEGTALFPFKRLSHNFIIAGANRPFDAERERHANNNVRLMVQRTKERILSFVDSGNVAASRKRSHYIAALDRQLAVCDETDRLISSLESPFPNQRQ